jgi:hypothetical protein
MSLTVSQTKPPVSSFLVDVVASGTYTIVSPSDEYIWITSTTANITLPLANTIYAGFRIRISNLTGGGITVAKQGSDTLTGTGVVAAGAQASFLTDGVSKWYLA